ncbi:MAG: PocR ligand-binding domain-containing protein [Clostridia bacterium]|nr:PocR ligand-binding domain-containing protein [Clostridia bacterium]
MSQITLESVLRDFHRVSGFHVSVCDAELNEVCCYPKEVLPFCKRIQQDPLFRAGCIKCDRSALESVKRTDRPYLYQCYCGLYEAIAPLYNSGVLSGFLMIGQVSDETPDNREKIRRATASVFADAEEQERFLQEVHTVPSEHILSYSRLMSIVAEYLTRNDRLRTTDEDLADLIKKYIYKHYAKRVTLDQLAEKFGCCKATVMNAFKKKYGMTVITYLNQVRLDNAEHLLRTTAMPIKEISYLCGFCDQNYFSKLFSNRFGCSPTAFRSLLEAGSDN